MTCAIKDCEKGKRVNAVRECARAWKCDARQYLVPAAPRPAAQDCVPGQLVASSLCARGLPWPPLSPHHTAHASPPAAAARLPPTQKHTHTPSTPVNRCWESSLLLSHTHPLSFPSSQSQKQKTPTTTTDSFFSPHIILHLRTSTKHTRTLSSIGPGGLGLVSHTPAHSTTLSLAGTTNKPTTGHHSHRSTRLPPSPPHSPCLPPRQLLPAHLRAAQRSPRTMAVVHVVRPNELVRRRPPAHSTLTRWATA